MKLTKNSWHYNWWMLNFSEYSKEPNKNFCDYFWALVLSVVLFPITAPSLLIKKIAKSDTNIKEHVGITFVLYLVTLLIFAVVKLSTQQPIVMLIIVAAIAAVALMWLLLHYFVDVFPNTKFANNLSEIGDIGKEGWLAFKGKYCPKVEWQAAPISEQPSTLNHE